VTNVGDIQLNINVNVRNPAAINSINSALANTQAAVRRTTTAYQAHNRVVAANVSMLPRLLQPLDDVERKYDTLFRASYRLSSAGQGLVQTAATMFKAITDLTDGWGSFEFMLNRAAGALQIWHDAGERANPIYEALISNVMKLTKELRLFPADDVAKATYYWASTSGQQVRNLTDLKTVMQAVNPLMKLAALTETSYEAAIKGVYSILVQYHRGLTDVEDITAKLLVVTQRTALEFPDLIQSFKYVGPVAGALGISFEEVAKTLGAIGDAGIRGSQAGRALRQMFIQTVRPTAKAKSLLDDLFRSTTSLGKGFEELVFPNGQFVGLSRYVNILATALKNADTRQRQYLYASISTANELPVLTALVENQIRVLKGSADAYDNSKASVDDAAYAASQFHKAWELLSNSWVGITGRLKAGFEVIRLQVGRLIAESLRDGVKRLTDILDKLEIWVQKNPKIVTAISQLTTALAGLAAVAGGVLILSGALLGLYASIGVIAEGMGPIFKIGLGAIGALATIAEAIVENWTYIQRTLAPAVERFLSALTGGKDGIRAAVDEFEKLHETIKGIATFIVKTAVKALVLLLDAMTAIVDSPLRPVIEALGKALVTVLGLRAIIAITGLTKVITGLSAALLVMRNGMIGLALAPMIVGLRNGALAFTALRLSAGKLVLPLVAVVGAISAIAAALKGGFYVGPVLAVVAGLVSLSAVIIGLRSAGGILAVVSAGIRGVGVAIRAAFAASPLLVITLVVTALQALWDFDFLGLRTRFEGAGAAVNDLREEFDNFISTLGPAGSRISTTILGAADSVGQYTVRLARARAVLEAEKSKPFTWGFEVKDAENKVKEIEAAQLSMALGIRDGFQRAADASERGIDEVMEVWGTFGPRLYGSLSDLKNSNAATQFAEHYWKTVGEDGALSAKEAVKLWNKAVEDGIKPNVSPETFLRTVLRPEAWEQAIAEYAAQVDLKEVYAAFTVKDYSLAGNILVGLKAGADQFGPEINATVNNLLQRIPKGFTEVTEQVEALAQKAPGEILAALKQGFESLGDIQSEIRKLLSGGKKPLKGPAIVRALLGDITGSDTTQALTSSFNELILLGQSALDNAQTQFIQAVNSYEKTGRTKVFANAIRDQLGPKKFMQVWTGSFKGGWWKKLTPEQQTALQQMVDWAGTQLSLIKPSPEVLTGAKSALTATWIKKFTVDLETESKPASAENDVLASLVTQMETTYSTRGRPLLTAIQGDWTSMIGGMIKGVYERPNPVQVLADGMGQAINAPVVGVKARALEAAQAVKVVLMGNSPPPEGPLRTVDTGGFNVILSWAAGLAQGAPRARAAASFVVDGVRARLNGSFTILSFMLGGARLLRAWVDGFVSYWERSGKTRVNNVLNYMRQRYIGESPPEFGPLSKIDQGGFNIGRAWVDGVVSGAQSGNSALLSAAARAQQVLDFGASGTGLREIEHSASRTVRVEVDVTSKDGSVNSENARAIGSALSGSADFLAALEHASAAS
jgi:TP901 family phage tail tape measure protein